MKNKPKNKAPILLLVSLITLALLGSLIIFSRSSVVPAKLPLTNEAKNSEEFPPPITSKEKQDIAIATKQINVLDTVSSKVGKEYQSLANECINIIEAEVIERTINDIGGNRYDLDGNETPENQYLRLLDDTSLTHLANQGYASAMVALAERLLNGDDRDQYVTGVTLAKSAAAHGREDALGILMAHYNIEQQRAENAGNEELANSLFINFLSIERLLNYSIPEITQGMTDDIFNASELSDAQLKELDKKAEQLINEYRRIRETIGLNQQQKSLPKVEQSQNC